MNFRCADQEKHLTYKVKIYKRRLLKMTITQLLSLTVLDSRNLQMYQLEKRHPTVLWINLLRLNYTQMKISINKQSRFSSSKIVNNKLRSKKCFRIFPIKNFSMLFSYQTMIKVLKRTSLKIQVLFLQNELFGRNRILLYL
jgi:hypothetical protein